MESYFQEVELSSETPSSRRSSESDDSQRLVIIEDLEDVEGPQGGGNVKRKYTYEEYKKICLRDFLLKKLTYFKLKRLMALYHAEISEKSKPTRERCITSWKTAKVMSKTLMMFHLMFEEIKENITLDSIYYQRMSDLISIYIDFEIKASQSSVESANSLSSRITTMMEKCLDHQYRFTLDTLLKSNNICNKFKEISYLLISRVVRGLPSTKYSEQSYIRSVLVFKLWIQLTNEPDKTKIFKLASHLAKPPKELMEDPSKFAKDILPCNFHKCYIDLTTYIIGTPWPYRKKIKTFLEHTRIVETNFPKKIALKSSDTKEEHKNEELADIMALKDVHLGLQKIILLEKKNKKIIRTLKNSYYKYAPFEELSERPSKSLEYIKISKKNTSNHTLIEQNGLPLINSKLFHEFLKQIVVQTDIKTVQNLERDDNLNEKKLSEVSGTNELNDMRNREILHKSIPKEATNVLNFDSTQASKKKTIMSVIDSNTSRNSKKNTEDGMVSTITVKPTATISNCLGNVFSKAITDWHTPVLHCHYNPSFPLHRVQSGSMTKGSTNINKNVQLLSTTSTLPLLQGPASSINDGQLNSNDNFVRSTDSLLLTNSPLPPACINRHPDPNLRSSSILLNKGVNQRKNYSIPGSKDSNRLFKKDTTIQYYPPPSAPYSPPGPFNDFQGMNSVHSLKDQNHSMLHSNPTSFIQCKRPHCSQANESFSFYDDATIANSTPHLMGTQSECPNLSDPHNFMANSVQANHPLPISLPSRNNNEPASFAIRGGSGGRNSSTAQQSCRKQSQAILGNIAVNMNHTSDNQNVQRWPNIPTQKYDNAFQSLDSNYNPKSSTQLMLRPPALNPNIIQNDPKLGSIRLPPYSSIRKKKNRFNPALPITDAPSNSVTTRNSFPCTNVPMAVPVCSSQLFSPAINNSFPLPVINIPSSLPNSNAGHCASTSFSAPRTSESDTEVKLNKCHGINAERSTPIELYQDILNSVLHKAIVQLTHKNNHGFLEYNFENKPNTLQAVKEALLHIKKFNVNNNTSEAIDDIVTRLSEANENFLIEKNMFPPQLLKINNIDIRKGKFNNIDQVQMKRHEATLNNDHLAFMYQDKIRNFYCDCNGHTDDFFVKSDLQARCYCLQCCANKIVLDVNNAILKQFRHYLWSRSSVHCNENEQNRPLKVAGLSKRSLEKSVEERDSPLPLKKRITSTPPNDAKSIKDSEVSYPSTPMISIAELELMKDISTNMIDNKTATVNIIPKSIVESQGPEICKNINQFSSNKPVPESTVSLYQTFENNESKIISNSNLLPVETCHNPSSSALIQSPVATQQSKVLLKNNCRKPVGRPRKNAKKI